MLHFVFESRSDQNSIRVKNINNIDKMIAGKGPFTARLKGFSQKKVFPLSCMELQVKDKRLLKLDFVVNRYTKLLLTASSNSCSDTYPAADFITGIFF